MQKSHVLSQLLPFSYPIYLIAGLSRNGSIVVGGMECTGSTFVYQVAGVLNFKTVKSHAFMHAHFLSKKLVTYRDPRDVLCSYAKRQFRYITERDGVGEAVKASCDYIFGKLKRYEDLLRYQRDQKTMLIRYEDYFGGKETELIRDVAGFLDAAVDAEKIEKIAENFSIKSNLKRSEEQGGFNKWDRTSQIHGGHISSGGKTGVWEDVFSSDVKAHIKPMIQPMLENFGYVQDDRW